MLIATYYYIHLNNGAQSMCVYQHSAVTGLWRLTYLKQWKDRERSRDSHKKIDDSGDTNWTTSDDLLWTQYSRWGQTTRKSSLSSPLKALFSIHKTDTALLAELCCTVYLTLDGGCMDTERDLSLPLFVAKFLNFCSLQPYMLSDSCVQHA